MEELALEAFYSPEPQPAYNGGEHLSDQKQCLFLWMHGCGSGSRHRGLQGQSLVDAVNVHDCGRLINPALAKAQVHGGMSMGIGYGLSECLKFDPKTGKTLNGTLLDYKFVHNHGPPGT